MTSWGDASMYRGDYNDEGPISELLALLEPPAWMAQAACRGSDPSIFFASRGESGGAYPSPALAICAGCSVRDACLDYGIHETHGTWGGTTPRQRQQVRIGRRKTGTLTPRLRGRQHQSDAYWNRKDDGWCARCANGQHTLCGGDCACDRHEGAA